MKRNIVGIIAWTVIGMIIVVGLGVVVLYGHSFGHVKSILWLIAFLVSFGMAVVCMEPLKTLAVAGIYTLCLKRNPFEDAAEQDCDLNQIDDDFQWKHYLALYARYVGHQGRALQQKQQQQQNLNRNDVRSTHRQQQLLAKYLLYYSELTADLIMFAVYLMTLLLVVLGTRDQLAYHSTQLAKDYLVAGKYAQRPLRPVLTTGEFWAYLENVLVPTIHPNDRQLHNTGWLPGKIVQLIGIARLRQQRRRHICHRQTSGNCAREFDAEASETRQFSTGWRPKTIAFTYSQRFARLTQPWLYQTAAMTESMPTFGRSSRLYDGGGYVLPLGRTMPNSRALLRYARRTGWLDRRTGVVFIELTLYTAQANLFNVICLVAERTPFGNFVWQSESVQTVRLLLILHALSAVTILVFVAFCVCTVGFAIRLGIRCCGQARRGRVLRYSQWMLLDTLVVVLSIGAIALFIWRDRYVGKLLAELERKRHNAFVSFAWAAWLDRILTCWVSVLIAMATVRLWKLLMFLRVFRMCAGSLQRAVPALAWTVVAMAIGLLALAIVACLLNGSETIIFGRTLGDAMVWLMVVAFGFIDSQRPGIRIADFMHGGRMAGGLLLLMLIALVTVCGLGVFVIIVCQHFGMERCGRKEKAPFSYWTWLLDGWKMSRHQMRLQLGNCCRCDVGSGEEFMEFEIESVLQRNEERLLVLTVQLKRVADMVQQQIRRKSGVYV